MSDRTYVEGAGIRLLQDNLERCFYTAGKIVYEAVIDHLTKEAKEKELKLPPGYRPAVGTQRCQSCRYGQNMGTFCSKYKTDVDPNYVCDNWRMRADLEDIVRSNTINYIKRINRKLSDISSSIPDTNVIGEVKFSTDVSGTGAATSPAAVVRHATYAGRGNQSPQDVLSLIKSMLAQSPMRRIYGKLNDTVDVESLKAKPLVNPVPTDSVQMQKVGQGQPQVQGQTQVQSHNQPGYINIMFARDPQLIHMATGMFGDYNVFSAHGGNDKAMLNSSWRQRSEVQDFLTYLISQEYLGPGRLDPSVQKQLQNVLAAANKQLEQDKNKLLEDLRGQLRGDPNIASTLRGRGIDPANISNFYIVGNQIYVMDNKQNTAMISMKPDHPLTKKLHEDMRRIASEQMWLAGSVIDTVKRVTGMDDNAFNNLINDWASKRGLSKDYIQRMTNRMQGYFQQAERMAQGNNALLDPTAVSPRHVAEASGISTDKDVPVPRDRMPLLRDIAISIAAKNNSAIYSNLQSVHQELRKNNEEYLSNAMKQYDEEHPHPQKDLFGAAATGMRTYINDPNSDIRAQLATNRDGLVTVDSQTLAKLTQQSAGIGLRALTTALSDQSEEGQRLRSQFLEYAKATGLARNDPKAFQALVTALDPRVAGARTPEGLEARLEALLASLAGLTGEGGPRPGATTNAMRLLAGFNAYTNGAVSSVLQNSNNVADRNAATVIDLYSSAHIQGIDPAALLRRNGPVIFNAKDGNMWIQGQRGGWQKLDFMSGDKNLVGKDFGHGGHLSNFVGRINRGEYGDRQGDAAKTVTLMYTNAGTMITTYDPSDGSFKTYKVSDKVVGPEYFLKQNANVYILSNGGKYHKVTMNENGLQVSTQAENIPIEWRAATANQQQFEQLRKTIDHINELNKNTPMSPAMRQEYAAYASTVYGAPTVLQFANPSMPSRNPFERPETKFYIYGQRPIERFAPDIEGMELTRQQVERAQLSVPAFASGRPGSSEVQSNQQGGQSGSGVQPNQQPNQQGGQSGSGVQPNQPGGQSGSGVQSNQQPNQQGGQSGSGVQPNQQGGQP
jgi:hypothetical protein